VLECVRKHLVVVEGQGSSDVLDRRPEGLRRVRPCLRQWQIRHQCDVGDADHVPARVPVRCTVDPQLVHMERGAVEAGLFAQLTHRGLLR
jgi:hypothetical protein